MKSLGREYRALGQLENEKKNVQNMCHCRYWSYNSYIKKQKLSLLNVDGSLKSFNIHQLTFINSIHQFTFIIIHTWKDNKVCATSVISYLVNDVV